MEESAYEKMIDPELSCDLCGGKDPKGEIYQFKQYIYLCPKCFNKIEASPEKSRANVERFLMGNVL